MVNYSKHFLIDRDFVFTIHLTASVINSIALLPNCILLLIILLRSQLRSRSGWIIANLLFSCAMNCLFTSIYCVVKTFQLSSSTSAILRDEMSCYVFSGITILFIHGPLWSLSLLAIAAMVRIYSKTPIGSKFTLLRLVELRIIMVILDLVLTYFSLDALRDHASLASQTRCTWQYMIQSSQPIHIYRICLLILFIVLGGLAIAFLLQNYKSKSSEEEKPKDKLFILWTIFACGALLVLTLLLFTVIASNGDLKLSLVAETLCPGIVALLVPCLLLVASEKLRHGVWSSLAKDDDSRLGRNGGLFNTAFEMETNSDNSITTAETPSGLVVNIENDQHNFSDDLADSGYMGSSDNGDVSPSVLECDELEAHKQRITVEVHATVDGILCHS